MTLPVLPPPELITQPDHLLRIMQELRASERFALDTESNSLYAYHYRVCLIQISTAEQDYLIDTIALPDQTPLKMVVADPAIEVTIHAAENDILLLHRDFGFRFGHIFDTLWAARVLGWSKPGLASILNKQYGIKLDKRMQRTDWGRRPLSAEQMEYARLDTHYLLRLRDQMEQELRQHKRWREAVEVFEGLREIVWEEKEAPTFWRLNGVNDLTPGQQAVLQALFDWREANASRRDVPPFKVMRNEVLISLAQEQPADEHQLRQIQGISQRLPSHVARKLLKTIRRGQQAPPPQPPPRNHNGRRRPDDIEMARFDRLRHWRRRTADARGVESDVILTNAVLMALARANPADLEALTATDLLSEWKIATYGPEILRVCAKS